MRQSIKGKLHILFFVFLTGYLTFFPSFNARAEELRGTWISYLDWAALPKEQTAFEAAVDEMMENCSKLGLNTVFVHAHSHSDSYYPSSQYFPTSKFAAGIQGQDPGYDPFGYVVKSAHSHNLKIHAWFNPYRITGYMMSWDEVSPDSIVKKWQADSDSARNVLIHEGQYYLNPSKPEVLDFIAASVNEVVSRYDVDGIQFDDYFYPTLNDSSSATWFDKPEYDASGSQKNITQWRRDNVSRMVCKVNQEAKRIRPGITFGISPQGSVANLRSDRQLFVDIDEWLSTDKYIDYIMPQVYWGFEQKLSDGTPAPYSFDNCLETWTGLTANSPVKLYLGLGLYKGGSSTKDGNEVSEWSRRQDIIAREVTAGRQTGKVSGYCFYSYSSFFSPACKQETENLLKVLGNSQ